MKTQESYKLHRKLKTIIAPLEALENQIKFK